jgi:hypothetical protein
MGKEIRMLNVFDKGDQEGQLWEYLDDLDFYASHPEEGWSSKKKMFEIMWHIQNSMKTIKEFPEEKEWVKTRLAKNKEDELTMKSKRIK